MQPIAGLVATDARLHQVDWAASGTWLWIGLFAWVGLIGAGLLRALRTLARPAGPFNEAALVVSMRGTAGFLGGAFVLAGLGGFFPATLRALHEGTPALRITANYGYLIDLFPV